eukprot:364831-Chlamydomonas_euryale.AAC.13
MGRHMDVSRAAGQLPAKQLSAGQQQVEEATSSRSPYASLLRASCARPFPCAHHTLMSTPVSVRRVRDAA